ncbi:MAG: benzoyl-CoA 2,3-epoxidase subunit BoxA [Gammaproteobacteria bacterium]|nr:benzoyl-CoA 2,3-epoxidase subunit BoxA [Gammaproteobacteria bacterium]MBU0827253.1 benzoyl-CoA 2,3-epoxidase subunit BoxA [Gammaproteobacteria bacterium]MBU1351216.1 benzoyl-CoA 2,3-epoxidase subunit BoxA [Gammaproteobacteria bacterium]MBU1504991.1 benzoyl-CoA 2,3-epoxidase subunit BoxA [Gammaproteobacteria bacterium]MBU2122190.1 benzoyl-CoA 2,3-epoxidase subunit BoxA [Gammaproteobacteria bacterium]
MDTTLIDNGILKQHLIDPEICIRCNTCEATCPVGAITHDDNNYVVRADVCNGCMACISPCPTGSIDNWRSMPVARAYSIEEQLTWEELPPEIAPDQWAAEGVAAPTAEVAPAAPAALAALAEPGTQAFHSAHYGATVPPWSAAHPYTNLFPPKSPTTATVVGNFNCTEAGFESETHHVVLDFGSMPFPVLEGQSIGIIPPGTDALGKAHHARQYSVASPRNGERPGYNNLALTVKRVTTDHDGNAVRGIASNFVCDLKVGDKVQVVGPFGSSFLMPNHPRSHIVMICTGTGSAPMRAMTEWRRRLRSSGKFEGGKLMLFFGARTQQELPYFGPLQNLPKDFIDINLAFSRTAGQPKRYVQDLMRERVADLAALLRDGNSHFYVCGLKSMEEGVVMALRDISNESGADWETLGDTLKREGRLHLETY